MKTPHVTDRRRHTAAILGLCALLTAIAGPAAADSFTFDIFANGANEVNAAGVPNQGDPNGTAIGTIRLDNGTGSGNTGSAIINLTLSLIDGTLSGHHIHQAPSTTTGPIVLDFGNPNTILTGTPSSGTLSGTITGLPGATVTGIFSNPTAFYYNLHSTPNFPAGAVRAQLVPEPGSVALFALGALAVVAPLISRRRGTAAD